MEIKNSKYCSLEGKFLIASPNISDPRFAKTLIYMISDNVDGSMGIIVNKLALNLDFKNFFNIITDHHLTKKTEYPIHYGGPVDFDRGFILHSDDYTSKEERTLLKNNLVLSSNRRILEDLSLGKGPSKFLVVTGYSGWSSQQLSRELKQNSWLIANANKKILFSKNYKLKWINALKTIGLNEENIDSFRFSNYSGSA